MGHTPQPPTPGGDLASFRFYYYEPSLVAAIIFIVVFGFHTSFHLWQMLRTRTWLLIPFIIGGCFEIYGYVGRASSSTESPGPYSLGPFIVQIILILVAPALFAASIYMELGRIVQMVDGDDALFIRRTWLTTIFVSGDMLSFCVQATGGGLLASGIANLQDIGKNVVVVGLCIQVAFFGMFMATAVTFHFRQQTAIQTRSPWPAIADDRPWQKHMAGLYIVSLLIFARSIVRLAEYLEGYNGFLAIHEEVIYVADALLMAMVMATMNWIHPGEVAPYLRGMRRENGTWTRPGDVIFYIEQTGQKVGSWKKSRKSSYVQMLDIEEKPGL